MRFAKTTPLALLALCALLACASGTMAAGALADTTGGVSSVPAGSASPGAAPTRHKAHRPTLASWFGPGFYGHKTACGQTLTPTVVGVANRTLPCGTLVKVTYKGHHLTVPVLDRGPYAKGVDWDLTAGAAQALGLQETVKVGTRVVGQTANTPMLGAPAVTPTALAAGGTPAS